jgi:hypothetical protein
MRTRLPKQSGALFRQPFNGISPVRLAQAEWLRSEVRSAEPIVQRQNRSYVSGSAELVCLAPQFLWIVAGTEMHIVEQPRMKGVFLSQSLGTAKKRSALPQELFPMPEFVRLRRIVLNRAPGNGFCQRRWKVWRAHSKLHSLS